MSDTRISVTSDCSVHKRCNAYIGIAIGVCRPHQSAIDTPEIRGVQARVFGAGSI